MRGCPRCSWPPSVSLRRSRRASTAGAGSARGIASGSSAISSPATRSSRIDWRQSAKSGRPAPEGWFIRETEWEAAQTVCLWRDASASMRWRSRGASVEKRDRAGLLLLALASLLLRGGERVTMIAPDARPISGRVGLDRLAEELVGKFDDDVGLPPRVPLPGTRGSCCSAISCRRSRKSRRRSVSCLRSRSAATCCRCSTRPRQTCPIAAASVFAAWSARATR